MIAVLVLLLQISACVGFGAFVLRIFQISGTLAWVERLAWSFVLGLGLLGWLLFFIGVAGLFSDVPLLMLLGVGAVGLFFLGLPTETRITSFSQLELGLCALLAVVLVLDCFEGVAPPGDADSLAYHFNLPKEFLREYKIVFVPRAIDGAVPLLVQMTYVPVLGLGGEKALTLWTMFSSWGVAFFFYVFCREHLSRSWSLALTLIWLTTPAVLYGGGSGQVEVRIAGFVLLAIAALMKAKETGLARYVAIAGMATGMLVGAKYTGLMFGAACGLFLFMIRQWPRQMLVFGTTSLLIGFQWYYWNWVHTGDPVFPMLFKVLGLQDSAYWDSSYHTFFVNRHFKAETALPNNFLWMLLYPFYATFSIYHKFDSERVGLGPFIMLASPFIVFAIWRIRSRLLSNCWLGPGLTLLVFYMIWYLTGSSQRVRHVLPVYPVLLLISGVALAKVSKMRSLKAPIVLIAGFTIALQFAANGATTLNYMRYSVFGESRDAFLSRNISGYNAVQWLNDHLGLSDRVFVGIRQYNYLLNSPIFYASIPAQKLVDLRPHQRDPKVYYNQIRAQKITHILSLPMGNIEEDNALSFSGQKLWKVLLKAGCVRQVATIPYKSIASRSLSSPKSTQNRQLVLEITPDNCTL